MKLVKDLEWLSVYEDVLTKKECKDVIEFCDSKLYDQPLMSGERSYRTSNQFFIPSDNGIDYKLKTIASEITTLPIANQEATSVIRYEKGQEYKEHHDYFHLNTVEYEKGVYKNNNTNRVMTVLFYLGDDCEGGETVFPRKQISITPKVGTCIAWVNIHENGQLNPDSLHAGLPVESGKKYIATIWVRASEFKI